MTRRFSVWFYIGAVLGIYGVLLLGGGVYQWHHPPATILAGYHATFWAGVVLFLVGGAYTLLYWPRRSAAYLDQGHRRDGGAGGDRTHA